ncbi:MAG: hypothetical protein H7X80_08830 [bacterium]|nr:hypothetical protein [Candidatus Kapabacteria bacterium]
MKKISFLSLVLLSAVLIAGCPSSRRIVLEGYNDAALNGKRVFVLLPTAGELRIESAPLFASSRGVDATSAGETMENELRTDLVAAIQERFDSNTVLNYAEQAVSGIVPLSARNDFNSLNASNQINPIDWPKIKSAGKEGNIDYLLVVRDVTVKNTAGSDPRGDENVRATYSLLDIASGKVMTSGEVEARVDAPRTPNMTHARLAAKLAEKLPFVVVE